MSRLDELAEKISQGRVEPPAEEMLLEECPFLWEMMTTDKWGDDTDRILPQLVIDRIGGGYRITLKDDALCVMKRATSVSLQGLFKALEEALLSPDVPWESFRSYRNKKGPKVPEAEKKGGRKKRK